jgi:hypothetical protein
VELLPNAVWASAPEVVVPELDDTEGVLEVETAVVVSLQVVSLDHDVKEVDKGYGTEAAADVEPVTDWVSLSVQVVSGSVVVAWMVSSVQVDELYGAVPEGMLGTEVWLGWGVILWPPGPLAWTELTLVMLIDTPVPVGPGAIVELETGKGAGEVVKDVGPGKSVEVWLTPVLRDDKETSVDGVTLFNVPVGPTLVVESDAGYGTELVPVSDNDEVFNPPTVAEEPLVCNPDKGGVKLCDWPPVGPEDSVEVEPLDMGKGAKVVVNDEPVGDQGPPVLMAELVAVKVLLVDDRPGGLPDDAVGPPTKVELEIGNGAELCEDMVAEIVSLAEGIDWLPTAVDGPKANVVFETEKNAVNVGPPDIAEEIVADPVSIGPATDVVFEVGNGGVEDGPVKGWLVPGIVPVLVRKIESLGPTSEVVFDAGNGGIRDGPLTVGLTSVLISLPVGVGEPTPEVVLEAGSGGVVDVSLVVWLVPVVVSPLVSVAWTV